MEKINNLKEQANNQFKHNDYQKAINMYEEALTAVNFRLDDIQKDHPNYDDKEERLLQISLLSNLALCYFKLDQYPESQLYNGKLLALDPDHPKGRYRAI